MSGARASFRAHSHPRPPPALFPWAPCSPAPIAGCRQTHEPPFPTPHRRAPAPAQALGACAGRGGRRHGRHPRRQPAQAMGTPSRCAGWGLAEAQFCEVRRRRFAAAAGQLWRRRDHPPLPAPRAGAPTETVTPVSTATPLLGASTAPGAASTSTAVTPAARPWERAGGAVGTSYGTGTYGSSYSSPYSGGYGGGYGSMYSSPGGMYSR